MYALTSTNEQIIAILLCLVDQIAFIIFVIPESNNNETADQAIAGAKYTKQLFSRLAGLKLVPQTIE